MNEGTKNNQKPQVYAFVDSQNLNLGVQKMGWKMDWRRFRQFLYDNYNVTQAYLFIGYLADNEAMYEQLHELGYRIVLKPTHDMTKPAPQENATSTKSETSDTSEKKPVKGNIDAELVLYAMKEFPNYDKAIVVSGDGDFYCLVEYLASEKKLLHVMTPNWQYSTLLKVYDEYIVRIDQLRRELAYHDRHKKSHAHSNNDKQRPN